MINTRILVQPRQWLLVLLSLITLPLFAAPGEVTDAECTAYGEKLAGYFNAGKTDEVVRQLDGFALVERITRGLGMDEKDITDFRTGFIPSMSTNLTTSYRTFTEVRFLRTQLIDGEKRLLLRCVSKQGAVNFLAFVTARRASGALKWIDVYTYLSGELLSESTRRAVLPLLAQQNKSFFEKLTSTESVFVKNFPKATQAAELIQKGKAAEAQVLLEELPAEVRTSRFVLNLRLNAAQQGDKKMYMKVISDWEQTYPDDPSLDLVSIDGDMLRKDYARCIKRLDSLSQRLGGDNYLMFLKGNLQMMNGENEAAQKTARAVIAAEPALSSAWDTLLNISLNEKKYAETVTLLDEVEAMYAGSKMNPIIKEIPAYAGFLTSAEYRAWAAKQEAAK